VPDPRLERLAAVLVGYSVGVRPGDLAVIEAPLLAEPLVRELYRRVLAVGGHPLTRITLDGLARIHYREASDAQLDWVSPVRATEIERLRVGGVADVDDAKLPAEARAEVGVEELGERRREQRERLPVGPDDHVELVHAGRRGQEAELDRLARIRDVEEGESVGAAGAAGLHADAEHVPGADAPDDYVLARGVPPGPDVAFPLGLGRVLTSTMFALHVPTYANFPTEPPWS